MRFEFFPPSLTADCEIVKFELEQAAYLTIITIKLNLPVDGEWHTVDRFSVNASVFARTAMTLFMGNFYFRMRARELLAVEWKFLFSFT